MGAGMASEARSAVRAARRSDLQTLADLRMRYLGEVAHLEPRLRLMSDARVRMEAALPVWMGQEGRILLVAEGEVPEGEDADGSAPLAGFANALFKTVPPLLAHQHVGEIIEVYVSPDARGRGLGKALVDVATEALIGRGAEVLRSTVPVTAEAGQAQLGAAGYQPLEYLLERRLDAN